MYKNIKSDLRFGEVEYTAEIGGKEPYFLLGHDDTCILLKCRKSGDIVIRKYDKPTSFIQVSSKSIFEAAKKRPYSHAKSSTDENGKTTTKISLCIHIADGNSRNEWIGMTFGKKPQLHVHYEDTVFGDYKAIDVNSLIAFFLTKHYKATEQHQQKQITH